jgi:hypothetical protein
MRAAALLLMLIQLLSACTAASPAPQHEAATPAPGTINVHMNGTSEFLVGAH